MFNRKGQSTVEYALIIAVVVAGLLLMQHYVKRGYAGKLKSASDEMGEQFDPGTYSANFAISQTSNVQQTVKDKETETRHLTEQQNVKTGKETVGAWNPDQNVYGK